MRHYWLTSDAPDLPGSAFRKAFGRNRPATLEGGKGGSAPAAPDPFQTAAATTQTNEQTAQFNKALNLNNNNNIFGSQQTVQTGTDPSTGAPIYTTQNTPTTPVMSQISYLMNQTGNSNGTQANALAGLQGLQSGYNNINGKLGSIFDTYGNINSGVGGLFGQLNQGQSAQAQQQGQNAAYASQKQYLDPQFQQQGESLAAQLANQGITPGSEAYNNAMTNFNNQKQQAYSNAQNQSILTGSQIGTQNFQNQLAGINTQAGLYGQQASNLGSAAQTLGQNANLYQNAAANYGQQVQQSQLPYSNMQSLASLIPGYSGTSQAAANPADIGSYINNNYQAQLANHNADVQSSNATTGAIGAGLGMAAMAFF